MHQKEAKEHLDISKSCLPALLVSACAAFSSVAVAEEKVSAPDAQPATTIPTPQPAFEVLDFRIIRQQEIKGATHPPAQDLITPPINPLLNHLPLLPEFSLEPESDISPHPVFPLPLQLQDNGEVELPSATGNIVDLQEGSENEDTISPGVAKHDIQSSDSERISAPSVLQTVKDNMLFIITFVGIPFLFMTWLKRAYESLERRKINDDIKLCRLESDIRLNVHRIENANGTWSMQIVNSGRVTVKELFGEQTVYADVLGRAASLSDASQPFPIFNFEQAIKSFNRLAHVLITRTRLPTVKLMSYNCRVRTRDLISAEFNPERRALDSDQKLEPRRIFGILVHEKSPDASTLVLCVIPETSFAMFGDSDWVKELKKNSDAHDAVRIDQLEQAYQKERGYLMGTDSKSVFPWAYVYFPTSDGKRARTGSSVHNDHTLAPSTLPGDLQFSSGEGDVDEVLGDLQRSKLVQDSADYHIPKSKTDKR